jgi:amidohydrolase
MGIKELADKYESYIIDKRRYFHRHPELSFEEKNTTADLVKELESMGIEVTTFPDYYGCIGTLKGGKPGPTVMLRADIDALPVTEATGLPFASEVEGSMHACGHDSHMAMLLGAAKILTELKEELKGTVKFIFQAAEESCHGAEYYVKHGCLDGVDAIMGMHIWSTVDSPKINFAEGKRMASCDTFSVKIHGVSAHASAPHQGKDAVVAAASVIMNVQTYVSRCNDPLNPLVVTFGTIKGGERFNVLANEVEMEGTIRTYSPELRSHIEADLRKIICDTAGALGCTAELQYNYFCSAVINQHADLVRIARDGAKKLFGEEGLAELPEMMGSEDFAYFMDEIPAVFGFIGSRNPEKGTIYGNHNNHYTVDEDALKRGSAEYAQFAYDYLEEKSQA